MLKACTCVYVNPYLTGDMRHKPHLGNTKFVLGIILKFLFVSGFTIYLSMEHHVKFPPNPFWYCSIIITVLFMTMLVSSLLLVAMTFDRFYSIIRPHKAASFNRIRRTRTIIICTVLFSIVFNIPHLFVSDNEGFQCTPFGRANTQMYGKFFYWFSSIVGFALPFVLLLSMNSVIIHKLRTRSSRNAERGSRSRKIWEKFRYTNFYHVTFSNLWFSSFSHSSLYTIPLCYHCGLSSESKRVC